jgi:uncharacterized membrane protein
MSRGLADHGGAPATFSPCPLFTTLRNRMRSARQRRRGVLILAILVVGSMIIALVSLAIGPY